MTTYEIRNSRGTKLATAFSKKTAEKVAFRLLVNRGSRRLGFRLDIVTSSGRPVGFVRYTNCATSYPEKRATMTRTNFRDVFAESVLF